MKVLLSLLLFCSPLLAAKGVVAIRIEGCDHFLIETADGEYTLAEWMGGHDPEKGDVLYGTLNNYGLQTLKYGRRSTNVYIEDYELDKGDALEQLHEQCDE